MKRSALILGVVSFFGIGLLSGKVPARASDFPSEGMAEEIPEDFAEELDEPAIPEPAPTPTETGTVRPIGEAFLRGRVDSLERRIAQLEDDLRFLEERTRNLDRRIDDLSRRH